ncbi:MAG TPA: DUF4145 domain-containing protein [Candidatus Glassbacteria bacterium]|nr:DUF4145 domain-containing protein [Candidatus Glassbacteria bacterium]
METKYVNPEFKLDKFNCPYCKSFSHQFWSELYWRPEDPENPGKSVTYVGGFWISKCYACREFSIWNKDSGEWEMVYPNIQYNFPEPNPDLSDEIKRDYLEAGKILKDSPRGTAALLRLCVQKVVDQLVPGSDDIFPKIAKLVEKGLETEIQEALDFTRIVGNEAVHPGVLDLKDDQETAMLLFETINLIADKLISRPKRISEAYKKLSPSKLEAIKERDKK